jgi:hypothetical protein
MTKTAYLTDLSPIVTLTNGKKVANFSSPHEFRFTDGTVLPAHDADTANALKIEFIETELNHKGDISLEFELTEEVKDAIVRYAFLYELEAVDVVFCPLPMITALKDTYGKEWLLNSPFRAVRIEDRVNKLVSIDKQCI